MLGYYCTRVYLEVPRYMTLGWQPFGLLSVQYAVWRLTTSGRRLALPRLLSTLPGSSVRL